MPRGTLVVPEHRGVTFLDLDGRLVAQAPWSQLVGTCPLCSGEGASIDGDGLLFSFTTTPAGPLRPGGIARLDAQGNLNFRVDPFAWPHDVLRDPADDSLIVVATAAGAVRWVDGAGTSSEHLRSLSAAHPEFPSLPNGAELLRYDDQTYLLLSHRPEENGRITLWDITTPGQPRFVWRFPAEGRLGIPHAPILRRVGDAWWLLWAHTQGGPDTNGTVGLAVTDDPTVRPTYVADLRPGDDVGRFSFLRGVELLSDGRLIVTDSGQVTVGIGIGRVFEAQFPDLSPPALPLDGGIGDQVFEPLGPARLLIEGLGSPFEAFYLPG